MITSSFKNIGGGGEGAPTYSAVPVNIIKPVFHCICDIIFNLSTFSRLNYPFNYGFVDLITTTTTILMFRSALKGKIKEVTGFQLQLVFNINTDR